MTNFIIGAIFGIAVLLLLLYIIAKIEDTRIKEELGEDYENVIMPKSKMDISRNVTICLHDDEYTAVIFDNDKNTVAFMACHPNNIKSADFYYSLFNNKEIIAIDYEQQMYNVVITQIKLINEDTLRIYYTVLNYNN